MTKPAVFLALMALGAGCAVSSKPEPEDAGSRVDSGTPRDWTRARVTEDQPDDFVDAYQIHVLYVEPSDRTASPALDADGTLRKSVSAFADWFAYRTGGPKLRFDTHGGDLDITYVKLEAPYTEVALAEGTVGSPAGPNNLRDRLENILKVKWNAPRKLYLAYWDGLGFGRCGAGPVPPELPGHFTVVQVGGQFFWSFLTAPISAGDTSATVSAPSALPLPPPPFSAKLGTETVTVTALTGSQVTFAQAVSAPHPSGALLETQSTVPPCRQNPFSADGHQLNYWEFVGVHELLHPLGIVPADAPHVSATAPHHLDDSNQAGKADLMYQGSGWDCQQSPAPAGPAQARCTLDPAHVNYFMTGGSTSVDLAKSVFLEPAASDAVPPPSW